MASERFDNGMSRSHQSEAIAFLIAKKDYLLTTYWRSEPIKSWNLLKFENS